MSNIIFKATLIGLLSLGSIGITFAADETMKAEKPTLFTPKDMQWSEGPNSIPKGAKISVLEGDLSKEGPFTIRIMLPANYTISPHTHPGIEHVTVISGEFNIGMGDKLDKNIATKLPTGSFAFMDPQMHHYAFTRGKTVIQLHGIGPWDIIYINPKDDPRNSNKTHETM
ncbi:cupin domain-containing protein [Legionella sp. PC997]|uniref:cupin domain-containing protein n=1 Tax=Legionella sp. PC997 TaxID=2755562 RepID=UPI0015F8C7D0|nr:cupin domain-containing protein [Legionella sp. PC997]QMT59169.1 hypothetical protein HBNCFIEN_00530 [Legionella sp. PC997]